MSLTSSLQRIVSAKADLKTSIEAKGVTVPSNASIVDYPDYIDAIQTGGGGGSSEEYDALKGIVDGSIVTFKMPSGMTEIKQYRMYNYTSVTSADLTGCTNVGQYAFYQCTNLTSATMPNVTTVGQYAFYNDSSLVIEELPTSVASIGQYGMYNVKVKKIDGNTFTDIGVYGLNTDQMTKLHAKITGTGSFGNNAIVAKYVTDFDCSQSDYSGSSLPNVFSSVGCSRSNPSSNILTFDYRNCTSTQTSGYITAWSGMAISYCKYFFPSTIKYVTPSTLAFASYCDFYFTSPTPPSLQNTNAFQNSSNYKIYVPYNAVKAYKNATNWSSFASYIVGCSYENEFELGETLPEVNAEGYGLTWYSDASLTTPVTTVSDPTQILYCVEGNSVIAYFVTEEMLKGCTVTISDGVNTYGLGDYILTNTVVTITGVPSTTGYIPYIFKVNGTSFTSGDTLTVTENIKIVAMYYDGVNLPYNATLENNSWQDIKEAIAFGVASSLWSVGDTKTITDTNSHTYTMRLIDKQVGRYTKADGTPTTLTFESVGTKPTWYTQSATYVNYNNSTLKNLTNNILETLPDLSGIVEDTIIKIKNGYNSTETSFTNCTVKLFPPAYAELFPSIAVTAYVGERVSVYSGSALGGFDYYVANDSNTYRKKDQPYWTRSPYSYNRWYGVTDSGGIQQQTVSQNNRIAFCFAL